MSITEVMEIARALGSPAATVVGCALLVVVYRRMNRIEGKVDQVEAKVSGVEKRTIELAPNGGESIKDRVGTIHDGMIEMRGDLRRVESRLDDHLEVGRGNRSRR